jgi:PAS domain S-box-containing protein
LQFRRKKDLQNLDQLCRNLDENTTIFHRIVANTARLNQADASQAIYLELDKRLVSQLLLKAMAVRNAAADLQNSTEQRVDEAFRRLAVIVGFFGFTVALITALITRQISRMIRKRLNPLHAGLTRLADGDLEHRITGDGSDEFSELAHSVNAMADKLQGSTRQLGEEISRRLVATAAQESERRFRAWFDLPLIGVCITSPEKGWIEVNGHLCTLLGYQREELMKKPWTEITHPDDLGVDRAQFERMLDGALEGYALEKHFLRKDGAILATELAVRCIRKGDGSVDYVVTLIQDITERKRAEGQLQESEQKYRTLVDNLSAGVVVHGADTSIQFSNPMAGALLGLTEDQLRGKTALDPRWSFLRDDGTPMPPAEFPVNRVMATGMGFQGQVLGVRRPDRAEPVWVLCNAFPTKDERGVITQAVVTFNDISERKQAEEDRAKLQAQLQQAQKMESLGSLAGGVAHDMNNVLGAILGLASAHLEIQPAASPAHRAFETITKAANRGRDMVNGLLGFARRGLAEEAELDLNAILREDVQLLEHTTLSKIRLGMDLADELRPILGDASALTHAIMNLCVNAVDAMADSGTLTLRTRNVDNDWIEVLVEDTGTGMSPEVLERALDPFFTTKGVGKGTGLGLPMVYSTVKAHRGQMDIQSEPGRGTTVRLRFPSCVRIDQIAVSPAPPDTEPSSNALRVLLVDDDELIQNSTQMLLEVLGHSTMAAFSGEEALAKLESGFRPNVVILDMNMPGLGGTGTLPRLRALCPEVPILLATGRVDQAALNLAAGDPHLFIMPKPFTFQELKQRLEAFARE